MKLLLLLLYLTITLYAEVDSFSNDMKFDGSNGAKRTKSNLHNGAVSEHISSSMYKKNGYSQINAEVGRNGVDGLFIKKDSTGKIKTVVFSEVKHGDAKLGWIQDPKDKTKRIKQMSKEWKIIKLDEKIASLRKLPNSEKAIKELNEIKKIVEKGIDKSQITRINNLGGDKYSITVNELNQDGTIGKQLKHKLNDNIIDLNKQYPKGSDDWKQQKMIKDAIGFHLLI